MKELAPRDPYWLVGRFLCGEGDFLFDERDRIAYLRQCSRLLVNWDETHFKCFPYSA